MTSPNDMDRPATVLSASLGVLLIAISVLLFLFVGGSASTTYNIAWSESEVASEEGTFTGTSGEVTLTTPSVQASNVTVFSTCADTPGTPARPATVTWTLKEGSETLGTGTFACAANDEVARVAVGTHPDVGSMKAGSPSSAEQKSYALGDNETRTFVLTYSYTRPASPIPGGIPVGPQPSIAGGMGLTAEAWRAQASTPEEATR